MRLVDADALMKYVCCIRCGCKPDDCDYKDENGEYCDIAQFIDYAPTAFDVQMLMKKLATLDRIAKSNQQKALLGRVFFIIENMMLESSEGNTL